MASSIAEQRVAGHLERLENLRPRQAKADLNPIEIPWREQIGHAIQRALSLAGLSQKEAAALVGRDVAQLARWINGSERPQLDAMFAVEVLRSPLVIALAELAGAGVEVETVVRVVRRTA